MIAPDSLHATRALLVSYDPSPAARRLWRVGTLATAAAAAVVVIMSYWTDVFPDSWRDAVDFVGWRFAFLVLTVTLVVHAAEREVGYRRVARRLQESERRIARLVDLERARAEHLATVSHQMKTPLTSVLGYAAILRKDAERLLDGEAPKYVGVIETQGKRLKRLVEQVLEAARVDEGSSRPVRERMDVAAIARAVGADFCDAVRRRVDVDCPDEGVELYGDPGAVEHVLSNLVDNAIKYSHADEPVRIEVVELPGSVEVRVVDRGIGIPPDERARVFERYRRANGTRRAGSVGLGLWITRALVEAQGGTIDVTEPPGGGSRFTVSLPRRR